MERHSYQQGQEVRTKHYFQFTHLGSVLKHPRQLIRIKIQTVCILNFEFTHTSFGICFWSVKDFVETELLLISWPMINVSHTLPETCLHYLHIHTILLAMNRGGGVIKTNNLGFLMFKKEINTKNFLYQQFHLPITIVQIVSIGSVHK